MAVISQAVRARRRAAVAEEVPALTDHANAQGATRVVHCRRDAFDIYCGRPMPRYPDLRSVGWGNPFRTDDGRLGAISRYRNWVLKQPRLIARLPELRGKALGCWCAPKGGLPGNLHGQCCHGEVLAALADLSEEEVARLVRIVAEGGEV